MAETVPVLTQTSQKSALFGQFLDGFSGFWHLVAVLQHFFSSLLGRHGAQAPSFGPLSAWHTRADGANGAHDDIRRPKRTVLYK